MTEDQRENTKNNKSRIVAQSLGIIFTILISLILAELILWVAFPIPLKRPLKIISNQNIPGLKEIVAYERNQFGLRSLSMKTKEKPPGNLRIICLGASTTDQTTQNTEDTWSGILETKLRQEFKTNGIEVAAYGRGGERAYHILKYAKNELLDYQPDLVILLLGFNHLRSMGGPGYQYTTFQEPTSSEIENEAKKKHFKDVTQLGRRLLIFEHKAKSIWALLTGKSFEFHSRKLPELRKRYQGLPFVEIPVREPDPIHEFSDTMSALLEFLVKSGIDVIVLGQPVIWKEDMSGEEMASLHFSLNTPNGEVRPGTYWLEREMSQYNEVQRQLADRFNADFIDLNSKIPKTLDYFFDDCHFTDRGSRQVAEEIFPALREHIRKLL
jgi:lysophospholipase L1-like esterase